RRGGGEAGKDCALGDTFGDLVGGEYEIEPYVRVPGREGEPLVIMQAAVNVDIARVEHYPDRFVANLAAGHPIHEPQPGRQFSQIERLVRSEGVQVAGDDVRLLGTGLDLPEQCPQLAFAALLGPV